MQPESPVLLDVIRTGFAESHHRARLVFLDPSGAVEVYAGAAHAALFPRSALKPLQAVTLVEAGYPGRGAALALAAASHDGEPLHVEGARAILDAAGLDEDALQCPPDLPGGRDAMLAHVAAGGGPSRLCHNCSGKHAAVLSTCVANGWDTATYRDPEHPLQQATRDTIGQLTVDRIAATGVDGCGLPAHAITLIGLARSFAAIAMAPAGSAAALVRDAMQAHPRLVGGTGRAVTELTEAVGGLLCKDGAEGVWGAALPDGRAFAVKVADGSARALPPLLAAALRYWGVDHPCVDKWSAVEVLGGGAPVGSVSWSPALVSLLSL